MSKHPPNRLFVVADVGGTNTRVALAEGRRVLEDTVRRYRNADYPGLDSVLRLYVEEEDGVDAIAACAAVAGPVRDGRATLTNLDWSIDKALLARATQAETTSILNDLQAQGHALGHIDAGRLKTVMPFPAASPAAARLVIGVGTGFNAAPVYEEAGGRLVPPAEAGHVSMPVLTEADMRLCRYVATAHGFPAVEDVLSGRGLERVYAWMGEEMGTHQEAKASDIMERAGAGEEQAREAVRAAVRMLGITAGNLALTLLPFGGIFLIGGVVRALEPWFGEFGFADAFRDKGRFAGFMGNFGVAVVEDDFAALTGCAAHLTHLMGR